MSRHARATLELKSGGVRHAVELRPKPSVLVPIEREPGRMHWGHSGNGVRLEVYRYDCQPGPVMLMPLDETQAFLRSLQSAIDEAYRREKEAFKAAARELQP